MVHSPIDPCDPADWRDALSPAQLRHAIAEMDDVMSVNHHAESALHSARARISALESALRDILAVKVEQSSDPRSLSLKTSADAWNTGKAKAQGVLNS